MASATSDVAFQFEEWCDAHTLDEKIESKASWTRFWGENYGVGGLLSERAWRAYWGQLAHDKTARYASVLGSYTDSVRRFELKQAIVSLSQ